MQRTCEVKSVQNALPKIDRSCRRSFKRIDYDEASDHAFFPDFGKIMIPQTASFQQNLIFFHNRLHFIVFKKKLQISKEVCRVSNKTLICFVCQSPVQKGRFKASAQRFLKFHQKQTWHLVQLKIQNSAADIF